MELMSKIKKKIVSFFSKKNIKDYLIYKKFKKENSDSTITIKISNLISSTKFYKNNFSENFYFRNKNDLDIILLQYIIHSQFINNFHKKIIIGSYKNIIIPVEFSLYDKLKDFLKISKFISVSFFYFYVLKSFFIGIGYFFYKSFEYLVTIFEKKNNNSNSVFFLSLFDSSCIISNQDNKFNLFSWFKSNIYDENDNIKFFCHNIKKVPLVENVRYVKSPIKIYGFKNFFIFFIYGSLLFLITILNLVFLRWKLALLFKEILSEFIIKKTPKEYLFRKYFFNNASWLFKPLWTYEAERHGSEVILFFFSMNIENIKKSDKLINKTDNFWNICSWNNYYVWNEEHKNILHNYIDQKKIKIVNKGPIPYTDNIKKIYLNMKKTHKNIAIFDMSLYRRSRSIYYNSEDNFYKSSVVKKFYVDILSKKNNKNINYFFKLKRSLDYEHLDKEYVNFLKKNIKENNINLVPWNYSAFRLADECDASISFPFTSTSQIFKHLNKPSVYYDPIKFFDKNHLGSRGIQIIYEDDLRKFLLEI